MQRSLSVLCALLAAASVLLFVQWFVGRAAPHLWLGVLTAMSSFAVLVAVRFTRKGDISTGAVVTAVVMLGLSIPGTMVAHAGPVVLAGPIIVLALAMPYVSGRTLGWLSVAATLVTAVNLATWEYRPGPPVDAALLPAPVQHIIYGTICVAALGFLLWQFSARVTELRDSEVASASRARALSARLEAILLSSPTPIVVFDPHGRVELWNEAAESLFRVPAAAAVGSELRTLFGSSDQLKALAQKVRLGEPVSADELDVATQDGVNLQLEVSPAAIRGPTGTAGFVALAQDVGARKRLEAEFLQSQKLESVGLLAGGVAHDFNNLLTIIIAETSLLQSEATSSRLATSLQNIDDAAQRAADFCRQLLSVSKRQLIQPRPYDLIAVTAAILPMLERAVGKSIRVQFDAPNTPHVVRIDKAQFEQILLNLIINARDAMPDGGEVRIAFESDAQNVTIRVQDDGKGIDEAVRQRIFEPFFSTKGAAGTGLGLSTVLGIVQRARGEVHVDSAPGEGAEFRITLPVQAAESAAVPTRLPPAAGLRVLIVDDDASIRKVLQRMLQARKWEPVLAADGADALDKVIADRELALVITDVVMPGMSGRELADRVAKLRPELPVLLMSGFSADRELANRVEKGEALFMSKPFTGAQLDNALLRAMGKK